MQDVPQDVDLVVMEGAVNDPIADGLDGQEKLCMERTLRHLLQLPHAPALLMFSSFSYFFTDGGAACLRLVQPARTLHRGGQFGGCSRLLFGG